MRGLVTLFSIFLLFTSQASALKGHRKLKHGNPAHQKVISHKPLGGDTFRIKPTLLKDFKFTPIPIGVKTKLSQPMGSGTVAGMSLPAVAKVAQDGVNPSGTLPNFWWPLRNWCWWPENRKDWKLLTRRQKSSYLAAEVCLRKRSSLLQTFVNTTLIDDYAQVHIDGSFDSETVHYTASFLPWHRLFLKKHADDLRLCGYFGPIPYWDWASDADALNVRNADIFDDDAFGGDGPTTGAFVNQIGNVAAVAGGAVYQPHYVTRNFVPGDLVAQNYNSTIMGFISKIPDYFNFLRALEAIPHDTVHSVLGGMGDLATMGSPIDPLFFLIHGNVDRIWAKWQQNNPSAVQYQGPRKRNDANWDATTSDVLNMYGLTWLNIKVSDVLNTRGGYLCYSYDK